MSLSEEERQYRKELAKVRKYFRNDPSPGIVRLALKAINTEESRNAAPQHVCGMHGFGLEPGDVCGACAGTGVNLVEGKTHSVTLRKDGQVWRPAKSAS